MSRRQNLYTTTIGKRAASVHGGAGGYGTRISTPRLHSGGLVSTNGLDPHEGVNKRTTMQNLNQRLASYLEKVHELERENERLETQIREWCQRRSLTANDYGHYFATIQDLKSKIKNANTANKSMMNGIENRKVASDNFRTKYEEELKMSLHVQENVANREEMLKELRWNEENLNAQEKILNEELILLKKNHEEDLAKFKTQGSGNVKVMVECSVQKDLNHVLDGMRKHYESTTLSKATPTVIKKTVCTVNMENTAKTDESKEELKELRGKFHKLQIALQSNMSMNVVLEKTLDETNRGFAAAMEDLQGRIDALSEEKQKIDAQIRENKANYDALLDVKARLEGEITEYSRILGKEKQSD